MAKSPPIFSWLLTMSVVFLLVTMYHIYVLMQTSEPVEETVELQQRHVGGKIGGPKKGLRTVFVHIPKTAGTTLRHVLLKFGDQHPELKVCPHYQETIFVKEEGGFAKIKNYDVIFGHYQYHRLRKHLGNKYRYLTIVREPLDHHISSYFYDIRGSLKQKGDAQPFWRWLINMKRTNTTNPQCHFIQIKSPSDALSRAKEFDWITTTDLFDQGMIYLRDEFGFKDVIYERRKVIKGRPGVEDLSDTMVNYVKQISPCDFSFYDSARKVMMKRGIFRYGSERALQAKVDSYRKKLPEPDCKDDDPRAGRPGSCERLDLSKFDSQLKKLLSPPTGEDKKEFEAAMSGIYKAQRDGKGRAPQQHNKDDKNKGNIGKGEAGNDGDDDGDEPVQKKKYVMMDPNRDDAKLLKERFNLMKEIEKGGFVDDRVPDVH